MVQWRSCDGPLTGTLRAHTGRPIDGNDFARGASTQRPDSRTGYTPRIDLTEQRGMVRCHTQPMSAQRARSMRRQQEMTRTGNHLQTLGVGPIKKYSCVLPLDGGMMHPGLILPSVMQTTQGLFGAHANKTGACGRLKSVSSSIPNTVPRYMSHDAVSMSSNAYSNFRKTQIAFSPSSQFNCSEYSGKYDDPNLINNARALTGGARMDIWGRSGLSLCSGSSRLASQII